ncbi:inactive polyglycylase TTLL10 isoform X2 [Crotalus tigris]|uniref:inactive polyglycylase TTLL10 isoform X2 n=1 Tax=Crotalus tigris TaxID=88082 RepID=UPI00192FAA81|nr:inactive polyglycylase TTLL10 isoform X2 [Crotalus tigris]
MEKEKKRNFCAFTVYFEEEDDAEKLQRSERETMQAAFEKFRRRRQEEFRQQARRKEMLVRRLQQPQDRWQLRMKFLQQAQRYIGTPYAKKYHQPGSPEYESPLFLNCCGLIRRAVRDLADDFGFYLGTGNQAYQYDTLPVTLPSEDHLKPGDLIFISGVYFDPQRKRQPHDIVHVEIWLGEGERSLGARRKRGQAQIFDSYKFVSDSYGDMEYHFKSIETWLRGICVSHCPEHKWASARDVVEKKSIFYPLSEQDEPAEQDAGPSQSCPPSSLADEGTSVRTASIAASLSTCRLSSSEQVGALDLQVRSRLGWELPQITLGKTDEGVESGQGRDEAPSFGDAVPEGEQARREGGEADPMKTLPKDQGQDPPGRGEDSVGDLTQASPSSCKVKSMSGPVGKWDKNLTSRTRGVLCPDGPPPLAPDPKGIENRKQKYRALFPSQALKQWKTYKQRGLPKIAEGRFTYEFRSKKPRVILKAALRMSHLDERRNEEAPASGPFFYIGGANGVDTLSNYCKSKGWQRIYDNRREDYILKWCETKFRDTYCNFREGEQLLYQIPNNKILTTKIGLLMNLREYDRVMKKVGQAARLLKMEDFFPETFRLDTKDEREVFFEMYREPQIWICKPTSSNQGRGIFLLKSQAEVRSLQAKLQGTEEEPAYRKLPYKLPQARIVQRYIDRPLLLEGKKFDVRSYLLIACTVPYMVFFGHGYVRLTCLNYDPKSDDLTSHLTNQYVQKKSPIYTHVKEETVWLMDRFNNYVNEKFRQAKGLPRDWVLNSFTKRMKEIMLQCFLSVKSKLECKLGFFDLIGCDFLIDEDFKVWLLEMNANPALHTNCTALRNVIPTVVNETLNLTVEIFAKAQKTHNILPLESLCHFVLLYNGTASNNGLPLPAKSKTSLCSLKTPQPSLEKASGSSSRSPGVPNPPPDKPPPPKASEKVPKADSRGDSKGEPTGAPEGLAVAPSKGVRRDPLPMPQIQISIVPSLTCCPSVKAILRGHQVCTSGNQYIIKPVPAAPDKAEGAEHQAKALNLPRGNSKDKSYATWFQQTFGTKLPPASDDNNNGGENALTSSQMLSLHLQSSLPPNTLLLPEFPKSFSPLVMPAKRLPAAESKARAIAVSHNCRELLPEEKKISHRGS